jgi:hypothetical protein
MKRVKPKVMVVATSNIMEHVRIDDETICTMYVPNAREVARRLRRALKNYTRNK